LGGLFAPDPHLFPSTHGTPPSMYDLFSSTLFLILFGPYPARFPFKGCSCSCITFVQLPHNTLFCFVSQASVLGRMLRFIPNRSQDPLFHFDSVRGFFRFSSPCGITLLFDNLHHPLGCVFFYLLLPFFRCLTFSLPLLFSKYETDPPEIRTLSPTTI